MSDIELAKKTYKDLRDIARRDKGKDVTVRMVAVGSLGGVISDALTVHCRMALERWWETLPEEHRNSLTDIFIEEVTELEENTVRALQVGVSDGQTKTG